MDNTVIPLHPAQHDVYTEQLLNLDSPLYNVGGYIRLRGLLQVEKFAAVVKQAPVFFDSFKLRFNADATDFAAYFANDVETTTLDFNDFSSSEYSEKDATEWMQTDFNTAFALTEQTPLCYQALLKISAEEHWFYGRYHHLITDGYGFIVWVKYLANAYRLAVEGQPPLVEFGSYLPQITFAANQYKKGAYEADTNYFIKKFADPDEPLLQKKKQKGSTNVGKNASLVIEISADQQSIIDDLKARLHSGMLPLTLAALTIYFGKSTGAKQLSFGVPIHKRNTKQLRNIIGMFSGILPFKCSFSSGESVLTLLASISASLKEDFKHQNFILGDVVRSLKLNYPAERLFEVIVNYEPFNFKLDFGEDIKAGIYQLVTNVARSPLQFTWQDHGTQQPLQLQVDYDVDYFNETEIHFLVKDIFHVFGQMSNGQLPVANIEIINKEEAALLQSFSGTINNEKAENIIHLFQKQAALSPDAIAVIAGDVKYTYQRLNEQSNQLAHHLLQQGVQPEALVPVCIERGFDLLVAVWAVLKAGAAYVPIDPAYPADRIEYMLRDTAATMILSSNVAGEKIPSVEGLRIIKTDDKDLFLQYPVTNPDVTILSDRVAYVIYTSGSTGKPKGVMITHSNVSTFISWCLQEFAASNFDIVYASTSICFDLSVYEIFYPLCIGKTVRVLENGLHIADQLAHDKNVLINTVPIVVDNLVKQQANLANVTVLNMAGEPVPISLLQQLNTDTVEVRNLYGPTEDTTYSTVFRLQNDKPVLIGKPISGTCIYVVNQQQQLVPIGMEGEICIGGNGLAKGYWNNPTLTAEKFISNPFTNEPGARLYKTGDLGRWQPDGNLEYLGRIDSQVKIRGYRIELGEIENALQQSGLVQNAVVVVYEDEKGNKTLVGYAVADGAISTEICNDYLKQKLPEFMLPALWLHIEKLPLTPNGKVDRKQLPAPVLKSKSEIIFELPANKIEETLTAIWKEVLELDRVSVTDNFFEVGGHSIKAIQVMSRLHKMLDLKVDYSQFVANPTIRQLGLLLSALQTTFFKPINKIPAQDLYELSHAQKRTWVLCQLKGGSLSFNSPAAFVFKGEFDVALLQQTLDDIIKRHESLRTVFTALNGQPKQHVKFFEEAKVALQVFDVSDYANAEAFIAERFNDETTREFDLEKGPLLRATLVKRSVGESIFIFNIHHIISDGWSKGILIREFIDTLNTLINKESLAVKTNAFTYKDYAVWQASLFDAQQPFWDGMLLKNVPILQFPVDFARPNVVSFSGDLLQVSINANITQKLNAFCLANQVTLNNLLFAAYGLLVAHNSNQQDVIIGSLASGRSHADIENMVGLFINFLPVRLQANRSMLLSTYIKNSSQTLAGAYSNQDYPFDLIVERYVTDRDISRNPLFDTMMNFHSETALKNEYLVTNRQTGSRISIKPFHQFRDNVFQSNLDFKLDVEQVNNSLEFSLSYNAKLFSKHRMERFLHQYTELLEAITLNNDKPIGEYLPWPVLPGIIKEDFAEDEVKKVDGLEVFICSSFVSEPVLEYMEYWGGEYQLNMNIQFADYNQVFQQLLNPTSSFNTCRGINVLFIRMQDWLRQNNQRSQAETFEFINQTYQELIDALDYARTINHVPIIVCIIPFNYAKTAVNELGDYITLLNEKLEGFLKKHPQFNCISFDDVAKLYEVETDNIFDTETDAIGNVPFTQEFYAALGTYLARKIRAYASKAYKVLAVDCDNTLWKGVCGEIGYDHVEVTENFAYLQHFLLQKYNEGFLIVLCSKNNEADVWEVFEKNKGMKLKKEQIAAHKINWNNKPDNLAAIAKELNVGIDSFIFIDDSAFEVEQMTNSRPEVLSLCLPLEESEFKSFLDHAWEFDVFSTTEEDTKRNAMYRTEKSRKLEEDRHGSINDFLQSLQIKVTMRPLEAADIDRAVQLSLRTNQFNMNGNRLNTNQIAASLNEPNAVSWMVDVTDRFGDYGTVGLILAKENKTFFALDTFLLSCRVLGRGVENEILNELKIYCKLKGLYEMEARFQSTQKNKPFETFLNQAGWQPKPGTSQYTLGLKYTTAEITS